MEKRIKIIDADDMTIIRRLAKKYGTSVSDFGKLITKAAASSYFYSVRVSKTEYEIISSRAENHGMTVPTFCSNAAAWYIKNKFADVKLEQMDEKNGEKRKEPSGEKRSERIYITFASEADYAAFLNCAEEKALKTTTLMRYCVLNYKGG